MENEETGMDLWRNACERYSSRQWEQAVGFLKQIEKNPLDPIRFVEYMGRSLFELKRYGEATGYIERWIGLEPSPGAYRMAAIAYGQGREFEKALDILRAGMGRFPLDTEIPSLAGTTLRTMGRLDEACSMYEQVLALKGDHLGALWGLGITLGMQGENRKARGSLLKAIAVDRDFAPAHFHLAVVSHALGLEAEATAELEVLRGLRSTFVPLLENILKSESE